MLYEYVDNYRTTLTAAVGSTDDTLSVDDSSALDSLLPSSPPSTPAIGIAITIAEAGIDNPTPAQVEHMVAIAADAGTIHVERDGSGTWDSGDTVGCRITSHFLNDRVVQTVPPDSPGVNAITIKMTNAGDGADGDDAVAIGTNTRASTNAVAIGKNATCNTSAAVAIGIDASGFGVSIGNTASGQLTTSTAVGSNASASGGGAIALGHQASSSSGGLSVGDQASATSSGSVAIGGSSSCTQTNSVALGLSAEVTASNGVALGRGATCAHQDSVALGDSNAGSTTTAAAQVMVGNRDVEITDSAKGYILPSPDGTRWRITIDDNGDLQTTSL